MSQLSASELQAVLTSLGVRFGNRKKQESLRKALHNWLEEQNLGRDQKFVYGKDGVWRLASVDAPASVEDDQESLEEGELDQLTTDDVHSPGQWFLEWSKKSGIPSALKSLLIANELTTAAALKHFSSMDAKTLLNVFEDKISMVQASLLASALTSLTVDPSGPVAPPALSALPAETTVPSGGDILTENLLGLLGGVPTESKARPTVSKGKMKLFLIPEMLDDPLQVDSLEDQLKEVNAGPSGTLYFLPMEKVKKKKALSQISPIEFSQANLKALRKNIEAGVITSLDQVAGYCSHGEAVMSYLVEDDAIKPKVYEFDQRVRVAVVEEGAE
ncbi:MAG: hypothetical protein GY927_01525 [bacterium]|nr:hypothetical protein [bacterium]